MIFGKLGMYGDEMEVVRIGGWGSPHRLRIQNTVADDPHPPILLGHQHRLSIRQKSDTPRVNQAGRDWDNTDPLISAHIENARHGRILRRCGLLCLIARDQTEHQQYTCGYDKRMRPHVDLHG
jgi:hypothetical protein